MTLSLVVDTSRNPGVDNMIISVSSMFNFAVKGYTNKTLVSNYGGPSFGLELILDIEIKY